MKERWRSISGFQGLYEVSDRGRVRSLRSRWKSARVLRPGSGKGGYPQVILCKNGKGVPRKVHRVELEAFVGPCPEGMEGCHNDGDNQNNFLENLRWDTHKNNEKDKAGHGTLMCGEKCPASKLTAQDVSLIRHLRLDWGMRLKDVAEIFGCDLSNIGHICKRRSWDCIK